MRIYSERYRWPTEGRWGCVVRYVLHELRLKSFWQKARWTAVITVLAAIGSVPGYLVGGGLYLKSRSYDKPFLSWTAQQLQDVMGQEGLDGSTGKEVQDGIASVTNSTQGYKVHSWREAAEVGVLGEWDNQHNEPSQTWLDDNHKASMDGYCGAGGAALLSIALAIAVLIATTWRRLTQGRRRLRAITKRDAGANPILIDGVALPEGHAYEPHLLVPGKTGAGKSTLLHSLIPQFRARGISGFAPDYGGELFRYHGRKGDLIFNPFDRRGVRYSFLADATDGLTRVSVSRSLFPSGESEVHSYFQDAGALIFEEALAAASTNIELWASLCDKAALIEKLKSSPAAIFMDLATREANSYLTTLMVGLKSASYLPAEAGCNDKTFSFRKFVHQSRKAPGRFCWFVIPERARDAMRPLVSALSGILISEILSLSPAPAGWRFLLCTDELGLIPTINSFGNALTNGRKAGLFVMSGVQHIEQIHRHYGSEAKDIISSFGTKMIMRQGDNESAEYWSKEIGATEVKEWLKTKGAGASDGRKSSSEGKTEHIRLRARVLPHELRELPNLQGYLQIGPNPAARVFLKAPSKLTVAVSETFLPRRSTDEPTAGDVLRTRNTARASPPPASIASTAATNPNGQDALDLAALAKRKP